MMEKLKKYNISREMQSHLVGKMKALQVFSPHLSPADDVMMQLEREDGSKA